MKRASPKIKAAHAGHEGGDKTKAIPEYTGDGLGAMGAVLAAEEIRLTHRPAHSQAAQIAEAVLNLVSREPGMSQAEIARRLHISPPFICKAVRRLRADRRLADGLIRRPWQRWAAS